MYITEFKKSLQCYDQLKFNERAKLFEYVENDRKQIKEMCDVSQFKVISVLLEFKEGESVDAGPAPRCMGFNKWFEELHHDKYYDEELDGYYDTIKLVDIAAKFGSYSLLRFAQEKYGNIDNNTLLNAIQNGDMECVSYIHDHSKCDCKEGTKYSCMVGNVELLKYFFGKGFSVEDSLSSALDSKNKDCVTFCLDNGAKSCNVCVNIAACYYDLDIFKRVWDKEGNNGKWCDGATLNSIEYSNIAVLDFINKNSVIPRNLFASYRSNVAVCALPKASEEMMKWLIDNKIIPIEHVVDYCTIKYVPKFFKTYAKSVYGDEFELTKLKSLILKMTFSPKIRKKIRVRIKTLEDKLSSKN